MPSATTLLHVVMNDDMHTAAFAAHATLAKLVGIQHPQILHTYFFLPLHSNYGTPIPQLNSVPRIFLKKLYTLCNARMMF